MKLTVMAVVAAMSLAAVAQGMARPGRGGSPMAVESAVRMALNPKMAEKLGVTEDQVAKLKALADNREAIRQLHEKARKGMDRQTELLQAEKVDEAAVMAALDEAWSARKEIAKLQTKRLVAVRSILTAEQIAKARETMKSMRGQGGRRGMKPGSRKGPPAEPAKAEAPAKP